MADISFLQYPSPLVLTGNPIYFRIAGRNAFTGGNLRPFYRLGVKLVELNISSDYPVAAVATSDILPIDWTRADAGVIAIDAINELLQESLKGHFTFPEPDTGLSFIHSIIKTFTLEVCEKYGIPPVAQLPESSNTFRYMQGKLSDFSQGQLNYLEKTFYDKLRETGMFLTNMPTEKQTDIYAPERLYFMFLTAGQYKYKTKQYFTDGTNEEVTHDTFTAGEFEVREFLCSYYKIKKGSKKLVKYEVYITTVQDNPFSEVRTFVMDYRYQRYARYFMLKNWLGVYEIMRTTGEVAKNKNVSKEFTRVPLPIKFTHLDRREVQTSVDSEAMYTIKTGFFADKYHAEWLQELLESDDVYWLKNSQAYPISVQSSKQEVSKDGDYNPAASFDITHAMHDDFTEEFIANKPITIGDFNLDFNTDFFIGGTVYKNKRLVKGYVRSDCATGYLGTSVDYIVPADKYTSSESQQKADEQALAEADRFGPLNANTNGSCLLDNRIEPLIAYVGSYTNPSAYGYTDGAITIFASKGLGPYTFVWGDGATGADRTGLGAGTYSCTVTDKVGNVLVVTHELEQPAQLFYNDRQSASFQKQCPTGQNGTYHEYVVDANTYSATTKNAANQLAIADINANGQNYADSIGVCNINASINITMHQAAGDWYSIEVDDSAGNNTVKTQNDNPQFAIPTGETYLYISGNFNQIIINYGTNGDMPPKDTLLQYNFTQNVEIYLT